MTFDDDSIILKTFGGRRHLTCKSVGIEWPPPEHLVLDGFAWERELLSQITDEQMLKFALPCVSRAALYRAGAGNPLGLD